MGEIASAHVSIYPKFAAGFGSSVASEMGDAGVNAGAQFDTGFQSGSKRLSPAIGALKAGLVGLVAGVSFKSIVSGFQEVTGAASSLNESTNKAKVIFGDAFAAVDTFASGAAQSVGMSKAAAMEATASFGNMFTQLGFTSQASADMSQSVVQMSADLGSFNNLPTADVADKISAAFRGEYDSLQALIPNINAARVEQEAMAMTGKTNAAELTAQEKAMAVLAIVQKDGAAAMGDFARTSEDAANKQKILSAQAEGLKARFGGMLAPIQELAMNGFEKLLAVGESFTGWLEKNPAIIDGFKSALSLVGDVLGGIGQVIGAVAVPALALLVFGFATVTSGIASFLEALGKIPGFEWATDAAEKVRSISDGAYAAFDGLNGLRPGIQETGDDAATADGQVEGLNGQLFGMPPEAQTRVSAPGASESTGQVDGLNSSIASIPPTKTVTINLNVAGTADAFRLLRENKSGGLYAGSGMVQAMASGGFASIGSQLPQIRVAGGRGILWAEEGAGPWEAFVSGHPGKRSRSRSITEEVARRLGGQVAWSMADGGIIGGHSSLDVSTLARAFRSALSGAVLTIEGTDYLANSAAARINVALAQGV